MTRLAEAITGAASVRRSPTGVWDGRRPVALAHHHRERFTTARLVAQLGDGAHGSGVVSGTGRTVARFARGAPSRPAVLHDRHRSRAVVRCSLQLDQDDPTTRSALTTALTSRSRLTISPASRGSRTRRARSKPASGLRSQTGETRCVPPSRHQHPMVARPTEDFATNVRIVRTQVQGRAAKSEMHIAASHRQRAGNSSFGRGNCLASCST
jgi:hypothetical protein